MPSRASRTTTRKLVLLGTALGTLAMLAGGVVGLVAYRTSRDAVIRAVYEQNLQHAQTLARGLDAEMAEGDRSLALNRMISIWQRRHPGEDPDYLCVIGDGMTIEAHTRKPELVGTPAGRLQFIEPGDLSSIADVLSDRRDWVGVGETPTGERQLVAYAYAPRWGGAVGLHRPVEGITAAVTAASRPWMLSLAIILFLMVPAVLVLLHWAHASARRETELARRALAESEARFRSVTEDVFKHSRVAMVLSDAEGKVVWGNQAGEDLFDLPSLRDSGMSRTTLLSRMKERYPSSAGATESLEVSYARGEHLRKTEWPLVKGEQERWVEYWSQPIQSGLFTGGRIEYFADVTERKLAQVELEETLSLTNATLNATSEGILVTDESFDISRYNDKFLEVWGFTRELIESTSAERRAHLLSVLKDPTAFFARTGEIEKSTQSTSFDEVEFLDGRRLEMFSHPRVVNGKIVGRVWSFRDVSERYVLEDRLRQSQKMQAIGKLAGGIAHDFNNLLTAILGYGDNILRRLSPSDVNYQQMEEILKAGQQAAALTNQLLTLSRKQVIRPVVFPLNDLIDESRTLLRRLIETNVRLDFHLNPEAGNIEADRNQIQQIILNLALNARDAMPDGGTLRMETDLIELAHAPAHRLGIPPGEYVCLSVIDDGQGMDEATLARIYDPFYTTKHAGKGTGLGLSIVYRIVEEFGGNIEVKSTPGEGTRFDVLFPRTARPVTKTAAPSRRRQEGTGTVLIAEDEEVVRRLMQQVLTSAGYTVLVAESGEEAEALFTQNSQIDLLLTDLVMPGMNGVELAEKLKRRRPEIKVIFVSGYAESEENRARASRQEARFLQKPFNVAELLSVLHDELKSQPQTTAKS